MNYPFNPTVAEDEEQAVKQVRDWVRLWTTEQREMVLWILKEEVRSDQLFNFEHENGGRTKPEDLN